LSEAKNPTRAQQSWRRGCTQTPQKTNDNKKQIKQIYTPEKKKKKN
jgi:hypothetical protein